MSEVMQEIQELEQHIANQKTLVDMADAAMRLSNNADFRKVIMNGFCLTEAARYVQESGDPGLSKEDRQDALNMAQASGHLKRFLSVTVLMGNQADNSVREAEMRLAELRAEA